MIVTHLLLKNWKNFRHAEVDLAKRIFLVGANASGKSNFLDVFRFLRDIAQSGGGLQKAIENRGGVSKIRCLFARQNPVIEIEISLADSFDSSPTRWKYSIGIKLEPRGYRRPIIDYEKVWKDNKIILNRPDNQDKRDAERLTQTHLEQINANAEFREIVRFFESIFYLHLVPQLIRHPEVITSHINKDDPFGRGFLERVALTPEKIRKARLKKIEKALQSAVPQLRQLTDIKDEKGIPHLEATYKHWRPKAGKQTEEEFSDGTLRLIGLLWSLLEGDSLLLLEEPELSLHTGIINKLPSLIWRLQDKKRRQVLISTHSYDLLSNKSIGGDEVLMLIPIPTGEGTEIKNADSDISIKELLKQGLSVAEVVISKTEPEEIMQLDIFND